MNKEDYNKYIKSAKWKNKKKEVFKERGKECEQCGDQHYIHVHHLTYERLGDENLEDLQILCYQCHMSKHDKYFNKFVLNKKPTLKKQKNNKAKTHKKLKTNKLKKIATTKKEKEIQLELCNKLRKKGITSINGNDLNKTPLAILKKVATVKG